MFNIVSSELPLILTINLQFYRLFLVQWDIFGRRLSDYGVYK